MTFKLGNYHTRSSHLFADVLETLLMVEYEESTDIYIRNAQSVLRNGDISPEEIDEEQSEIEHSEDESAKQDAISRINEDCLRVLEYREGTFGDWYPFYIKKGTLYRKTVITDSHKVYFLLLACSRLRSYTKQIAQRWASHFTELSKIALESVLPDSGYVKIFDANSDDRRQVYHTDLRQALKILGPSIGASYTHAEACEEESSSGDNGLDLVGVLDYEKDSASGYYVIFGQCAARETEWPKKTLEAHPLKFTNFFMLHTHPINTVFIPACYRKADGTWVKSSHSNGCVLHDRLRIMNLLSKHRSLSWQEITNTVWFKVFEDDLENVRESQRLTKNVA